jgi:hypothetical protein
MHQLSPQLLIAAAGTMVSLGVDAERAFGGEMADQPAARAVNDLSWDLKFIERCGYWSHFDYRCGKSSWPIPRGMSVNELALFAGTNEILLDAPEYGDLFLQYSSQGREFIRAGIVVSVLASGRYSQHRSYVDVYSIEGDTDADGGRCGGRALRMRRRLLPSNGDRFVRWTEICPARKLGSGMTYLASILDGRKAS